MSTDLRHETRPATAMSISTIDPLSFVAWHAIGNYIERRIKLEHHSASSTAWFAGWLFTIGYLQLAFWKAVLTIVLWLYYLGVTLRVVPH